MNFKDTEIGRIPFEWDVRMIQDVAEVVSGATPKTKVAEYWDGNIAWITPKDLSNHTERYIYRGDRMITDEGLKNSSAKLLPKGSVLFSSRAPIGYTAIAAQELCTNQGFKSMICNQQILDNNFMFYMMNYKKNEIENIAGGSTFKEVSGKTVKEFKIPIPPLDEQKAIAKVLSDLDEKIEINNKINKKLEEMAQAIFKQWFVDFEFPNEDGKPYKSSGGEMVESELGMIPKGWEVILLDEIVDTFNGYSYKGKELSESEDAMITIKNFDRNGGYKMDGLKEIVISDKVKPHHFVEVNDIIVAHTDLTQGAEIIGNPIMIFSKGSYEKLIMSMDTVKVKSKIKEMNNELLYFILKDYRFKQYALGYVNGTTVLHLSKSTIPQYKIALPYDKSIMNQLGDNLSPIMSKIANNFKENEKLIMLRDALLPKLMSGEIRVPMD